MIFRCRIFRRAAGAGWPWPCPLAGRGRHCPGPFPPWRPSPKPRRLRQVSGAAPGRAGRGLRRSGLCSRLLQEPPGAPRGDAAGAGPELSRPLVVPSAGRRGQQGRRWQGQHAAGPKRRHGRRGAATHRQLPAAQNHRQGQLRQGQAGTARPDRQGGEGHPAGTGTQGTLRGRRGAGGDTAATGTGCVLRVSLWCGDLPWKCHHNVGTVLVLWVPPWCGDSFVSWSLAWECHCGPGMGFLSPAVSATTV